MERELAWTLVGSGLERLAEPIPATSDGDPAPPFEWCGWIRGEVEDGRHFVVESYFTEATVNEQGKDRLLRDLAECATPPSE